MNNNINIESYGSGDSYLIRDVLSENISHDLFYTLRDIEIAWEKVEHKGGDLPRELSTQVEYYCPIHNSNTCSLDIDNNNKCILCEPIYRHPVDYETKLNQYSSSVKYIRDNIITLLNNKDDMFHDLRFNHTLIQLYRSGNDYIGDHCDKTLDIKLNSIILNYSLGTTHYHHKLNSIIIHLNIIIRCY